MTEPRVVLNDLVMGESVRRHDGDVWFCDWGAGKVVRLVGEKPLVVARGVGLPLCIEWLPGGDLLIVDGPAARLRRGDTVYADLAPIDGVHPWNDVAADSRGNVFVNNIGYDFPFGEPATGVIAVVSPDGKVRQVADDLYFPNGMAVTPDDRTLIVAESHGNRLTAFDIAADGSLGNRRVWAALGSGAPDGIFVDRGGAVWYADVGRQQCVRVREGGEVLAEVHFDRGAFDCALSADERTLYAVTADYTDPEMFSHRTGRLMAVDL